jgi:nicotinamidase-related amidase
MQSRRVDRKRAALVVIDLQQKLLPAIYQKERVLENSLRLIRGATLLGVKVLATEQYPRGLGATAPEIASAIPGFSPAEKLAFSACGAEPLMDSLRTSGTRDLILCGIEAHVCVSQSCLDFLDAGFRVLVAGDATSSRTPENHACGLERMRQAGAILVSTEMILFELLQGAGTEEFKKLLPLIK